MNIYHHHPVTGQFHSAGTADPSPMEPGVFLVPANATTLAPPTEQDHWHFRNDAWVNVPPTAPVLPTQTEMRAQVVALARSLRTPILGILDGLQVSALVQARTADAVAIETAKQGLRNITSTDLTADQSVPAMQARIMSVYAQLAAALPAPLRVAFAQVVA